MSEYPLWQQVVQDIFGIPKDLSIYGWLAQFVEQYGLPALDIIRSIAIGLSVVFLIALFAISAKRLALGRPEEEEPERISGTLPLPATGGAYAARWGEILRHMDSAKEAEWKLAVIEADKLLDIVLQRAGFAGGTIGERLLNIKPGQIQMLEGIWEAHKVRNRIAHDLDYFLKYTEAKRAVELYAQTLREFEAI